MPLAGLLSTPAPPPPAHTRAGTVAQGRTRLPSVTFPDPDWPQLRLPVRGKWFQRSCLSSLAHPSAAGRQTLGPGVGGAPPSPAPRAPGCLQQLPCAGDSALVLSRKIWDESTAPWKSQGHQQIFKNSEHLVSHLLHMGKQSFVNNAVLESQPRRRWF